MAGNEEQIGGRGEEPDGGRSGVGRTGDVRMLIRICLNARSIMNKLDEFAASMDVLKPNVVGITESWASAVVDEAEMGISG